MHRIARVFFSRFAYCFFLAGITSFAASPSFSHPYDFQFVPRIETGISQYTLEFNEVPFNEVIRISNTAQVLSPMLRLGGTLAFGQFYLDGYYHKTAEGKDDLSFPALNISESYTGDREEFTFTLGFQPRPGLTLFAGYRESDTQTSGDLETEYTFKHEGFFLGGAYSIPISDTTSLTINGAYADLDSNLDQLFLGAVDVDEEGTGDGFKFGAAVRTALSDQWAVIFSADYLSYEYDMRSNLAEGEYGIEERDVQLRVGIAYSF